MDYITTHWQEILSLGIVVLTAVLFIRAEIRQRKKNGCANCTLAGVQSRQQFIKRNS